MKKVLLFTVALLFSAMSFAQTIYYVKPASDGGDDTKDGLSWNTAYATIKKALSVATASSGNSIYIASGTFLEGEQLTTNASADYVLTLKGGFDPETNVQDYSNKTVIDGNNEHGLLNVTVRATMTIDNFTFQNAKGRGFNSSGAIVDINGAGIANSGVLTITNCNFINNLANNTVYLHGGAIANMKKLTVINSVFLNNKAYVNGGAIASWHDKAGIETNVYNSTFCGNVAISGFGGAIALRGSAAFKPTVTLQNCILWDNKSKTGGGHEIGTQGIVTLNHNIILGGIGDVYVDSSISGASFTLANNDAAIDAVNRDPLFVSTDDLSLQAGSPAIDKGSNDLIPAGITKDIIGFNRIYNAVVDLGAYERGPATGLSASSIKQGLTFYPNPAKDFVIISVDTDENTELFINDITGKVLFQKQVKGDYHLNLKSFSKGIYLIKTGNTVEKLVVE